MRRQFVHVLNLGPRASRRNYSNRARLPTPPAQRPVRRVVVTGMGLVTPLGNGLEQNWSRLIAGECGVKSLHFDVAEAAKLPVKIAATITRDEIDIHKHLPAEDTKVMPPFVQYAMIAATEALKDANWKPSSDAEKHRTGVAVGTSIAGLSDLETQIRSFYAPEGGGYKKMSPYFVTKILVNMAAGYISMRNDLQGPNHSVSTACATGAHSIGDAYRMIMLGDADVMVAGASDANVTPVGIAAFARVRALSTKFNDSPQHASRPFDRDRDGFVMGEGAGMLVLEELSHALARGAKIYAEIRGYGMSGDAYHITAAREDGSAALRAMQAALSSAGMNPNHVDYINGHATSTPIGDRVENSAIKRLLGQHHAKTVAVSATKGATGHLLGAAGSVESIFTILAIKHGLVPPTINLQNLEPEFDLNYVPNVAQRKKVTAALTNSFGFGGTNCSLLFTEYQE